MATLLMPPIDHRSMPIVPTARIKALMVQKQETQKEIDRLADIEQRKVWCRLNRDIKERALAEYLTCTNPSQPVEPPLNEIDDEKHYLTNLDFGFGPTSILETETDQNG